jgi:RNase H-fold protein (predicted Holliday junction resolvase)
MAVDYGKKNIGLAYCDELGITIQPLPSLPNAGLKEFIKRLQSAVQSLEIRHLVWECREHGWGLRVRLSPGCSRSWKP